VSANIEFKAELIDLESAHATARNLSGTGPGNPSTDGCVFFSCPHGRLKLRIFDDNHGELIFYERADAPGPRRSNYQIARTADPYTLLEILQHVSGVSGTVEKVRSLYIVGQTRIHIDQVKGLGSFLEIEVVLKERQSDAEALHIAQTLAKEFGIMENHLIHVAYLDLLRQRSVSVP
jgi:predicted adenylyl cyclase CyaB